MLWTILGLIIIGLMAVMRLSVREYPDIDPPIVNIDTRYRGASPEVVETRITQVLEDRVAGLPGVEKLTSSSEEERSQITIEFDLQTDVDTAASDVRDRVSRALGELPEEADPPEVSKVDSSSQSVDSPVRRAYPGTTADPVGDRPSPAGVTSRWSRPSTR